jgi:hypothetical protein
MPEFDREEGLSRRKVLECMTWVGTGVLWTVSGGVPHSLGLIDQALAQEARSFTFLQISDSHVGFDKPVEEEISDVVWRDASGETSASYRCPGTRQG